MQSKALIKERVQRNLLLLVDGQKTEEMLLANLSGLSRDDFAVLQSLGLIEPVAPRATRPGNLGSGTTRPAPLGSSGNTRPAPLDTRPSGFDSRSSGFETRPAGLDTRPAGLDTRPAGLDTFPIGAFRLGSFRHPGSCLCASRLYGRHHGDRAIYAARPASLRRR